MRLGIDLLFLIPGQTGGRETYARELMRSMCRLDPGLELTAFANRDGAAEWVRDLGLARRVVTLPVSARRLEQWAVGELVLLSVAGRRAGIELLHSPANFGPLSGHFARVLTLHDLQYRAVGELLSPIRRAGTAMLVPAGARRANRVITGSLTTRDDIVKALGLSPARIDVVPHGVSAPPVVSAVSEAELRHRNRLGRRPVVLCVAAALPHKNLDRLLEALVLIEPARRPVLVLVGAGTDGPMLAAQVDALGLREDVRLLGFQSTQVLEGLYALVAVVVIPTLHEGFGLPVIEAMSRGAPVACSDIPVLREVAGDAALRFAPERPEAIAAAILALLEDAGRARRLTVLGRDHAARFTWEQTARATLATYRRALAAT